MKASHQIEDIRKDIAKVRQKIIELMDTIPLWKDRVGPATGLLTCGMIALHSIKEEVLKSERDTDDRERGPSLQFRSRGIGLDHCPGCFVCGVERRNSTPGINSLLHNIAAFVASREEGETIVGWFGGRARVDYRESEPNWIQLKVGACDAHKEVLQLLDRVTHENNCFIRQADIVDSYNQAKTKATP